MRFVSIIRLTKDTDFQTLKSRFQSLVGALVCRREVYGLSLGLDTRYGGFYKRPREKQREGNKVLGSEEEERSRTLPRSLSIHVFQIKVNIHSLLLPNRQRQQSVYKVSSHSSTSFSFQALTFSSTFLRNSPISPATFPNFSGLLLAKKMLKPLLANCRAYSLPIPSVAPVTTAQEPAPGVFGFAP